jgi:ABC-2 type transport system ATP-binding protein
LKRNIGGEPSVHIRVRDSQIKKAFEVLKEYKTAVIDDEMRISAENPWEIMNKVSNKLVLQEIFVEKIEIVEPTLEDVFMKLTGRKLTEVP